MIIQMSNKKIHLIYIITSYNNIIISVHNQDGDLLTWESAGSCGFRSIECSTAVASEGTAKKIRQYCLKEKIQNIGVYFKGVGRWRKSAFWGLMGKSNFNLFFLKDITGIPHNGCSLRKKRRKKKKRHI